MTARVPDYQSYNCPLPIVVPGVTTADCRYPLIFTCGRVSGPKTTQPVSVWLQNSVTKDNISSSYHIYSTTLSIFILYLFIQKMCCVDITYLNLILCCTYFTYRINIMYLIQFLHQSVSFRKYSAKFRKYSAVVHTAELNYWHNFDNYYAESG